MDSCRLAGCPLRSLKVPCVSWSYPTQSFKYSDQSQHIRATQRFYQAVDTLAVDDALDALLSPDYVAVFGAGVHARRPKHTHSTCMMGGDCTGGATVGGAKHNDGDGKLMQLDEFKSFLQGFPARCPEEGRQACLDSINREFVEQVLSCNSVPILATCKVAMHVKLYFTD